MRWKIVLLALFAPSFATADTSMGFVLSTGPYVAPTEQLALVSARSTSVRTELRVDFDLARPFFVQMGLAAGRSKENSFGFSHSLLRLGVDAMVGWRQQIYGALRVLARTGPALELGRLGVRDVYAQAALRDWDAKLVVRGQAGFEVAVDGRGGLLAHPALPMEIRITLVAGYDWQPVPFRFDNVRRRTRRKADPSPIEIAPADLGTMNVSGWSIQLGFGLQY